jgi:hypothetical protein
MNHVMRRNLIPTKVISVKNDISKLFQLRLVSMKGSDALKCPKFKRHFP